ncbi:MAG TPA: hypothetical protein VJ251_21205, partial [Stellaceae bacterium]|nr:hypothetical protein [Stellaceae bacterium]
RGVGAVLALMKAPDPAPSLNRTSSSATPSTPRRVEGWNYSYFARVFQINMIRVPLWKTRNNLHPSYIAKLPKNSESWRINPTYQTSEETCARSPRALNGWRLISKPNADTVRLRIQTTSKVSE